MWGFIKENRNAVIFAVVIHLVFIAILVFSFNFSSPRVSVNPDVKIVKATVIDEGKIKKERERKRKEALKRKQEQERKQREAKKKAELKKKREAEKKKQLALKKKKEAEARKKKQQEAKRKAEELRKKQQEAERKAREADLKRQMAEAAAEEERQRQLATKRTAQQKEVDRYRALIKQAITNKWTVPVSAKIGQQCTLRLRLIPSGEVISVEVVKSSGDRVFDRSVEAAVFKASPLPLPPAESGLFDEFREINVPFILEKRS